MANEIAGFGDLNIFKKYNIIGRVFLRRALLISSGQK